MEKKLVKVGQLISILNQRMSRSPDTNQCRILMISPAIVKKEGDCNWSPNVSWNAYGNDRERAMPLIRRLVSKAQEEYDLLPAT